jgi:hypothetical protein
MPVTCKVCESTPLSKAGICAMCCTKLGIVPMGEARRPPRPCMRCNAMKFVRVIPRELDQEAAPMALSYGISRDSTAVLQKGFGKLEAYVCYACNYVEWYTRENAKDIPIGPEYMTEIVDLEGEAPYR